MDSPWLKIIVFSLLFAGVGFALGRVTCMSCCGSQGSGAAMSCHAGYGGKSCCSGGGRSCHADGAGGKACCRDGHKGHGDKETAADSSAAR